MQIWVDADACPKPIKELLFRAAERRQVILTLVANKHLAIPSSAYVRFLLVAAGADQADQEIVRLLNVNDLVITADIPLAAEAIDKGAQVLDPRGEFFSAENIRQRLSVRNFLDELRMGGVETGGPAAFSAGDKQAFANQLDRYLTRHC